MIIFKNIARQRIEDSFGKIVEVHPRGITGILHHDMDRVITIAWSQSLEILAKKLSQMSLIILCLRGEPGTPDFKRAIICNTRGRLAGSGPISLHGSGPIAF